MSDANHGQPSSRRTFIRNGALLVGGTAALGRSIPAVHAGENNTIRLALIGCGNRGAGAVANALNTSPQGPIELYAMADLHENMIESKLTTLENRLMRAEQSVAVQKEQSTKRKLDTAISFGTAIMKRLMNGHQSKVFLI